MSTFARVPASNRLELIWRLNEPEILGSPIWALPGETVTLTITVEGTNAPSSPSATVYKGRSDVTSTVMPSGSHTASGQVITLKPATAMVAGSDYAFIIQATVGGNTEQRKLIVQCVDDKAT